MPYECTWKWMHIVLWYESGRKMRNQGALHFFTIDFKILHTKCDHPNALKTQSDTNKYFCNVFNSPIWTQPKAANLMLSRNFRYWGVLLLFERSYQLAIWITQNPKPWMTNFVPWNFLPLFTLIWPFTVPWWKLGCSFILFPTVRLTFFSDQTKSNRYSHKVNGIDERKRKHCKLRTCQRTYSSSIMNNIG